MPIEAFVYDAIRTPRGKGKVGGGLNEVTPINLVVGLLEELKKRNDLDTTQVDDVVLGCVTPTGEQGAVMPKLALLASSWDEKVSGQQINRFCGSGLETVNLAAMKVASGWEDLVVAGGYESMSRVTMGSDGGAWVQDTDTNAKLNFVPQGISADLIATIDGYSREDVDAYAVRSHQRAAHARDNGYFDNQIIPVRGLNGEIILDHDQLIRPTATVESLGQLTAVFKDMGEQAYDAVAKLRYPELEFVNHVHTAGNSSGIVDGASLVLIGSEAKGKELGLKPRARIVATAITSNEPTIMLTAPSEAAEKVLKKAGMTTDDIDIFELNEAFASVVMRFQTRLNISDDRINVNGGAIAMGHPLGATGGMILGTVVEELERRQLKRGLVTLCIGGGMGIATIIERV
ncbi:acetyl-CoA C-acetyltransferase [Oceanicoccus sagamiensis]|uniref:Acetyl-CoA acetyltransferase n=1 Tax=Oceanicoccus sagamiensis TaxID=716816 RepID=A0A1X9NC91_9GAMM|nr:acetyl-CoA C-acetyltransferase [Oceanicoccus sagamiensis]ARN75650.1 acetyl-CoA acetyltransferase [Oceanicoccus sagamiensis]